MPADPAASSATVQLIYEGLAPIYDLLYGSMLEPGRRRAMSRLAPRGSEQILEVGVGTGFGLRDYPASCRVVAIDLSSPMLARAQQRLRRHPMPRIHLCRMDASRLAFADEQFDAIYAPYVINVVPDPLAVGREMIRVCRRGGRLVFLNHFKGATGSGGALDRIAGRAATMISGADWTLDLQDFIARTGLLLQTIDSANIPPVSHVVVCRKA